MSDNTSNRHFRFAFSLLVAWFTLLPNLSAAEAPVRREWTIDGVKREALVHVPDSAKTHAAPLVFGFHGHGGSMQNAARTFKLHTLWPEAIVVYMQGLNTPGRLTDPEGKKPGWQHSVGEQKDRDLKFFDTVLASLKQAYKVDTNRVFSTGHSNGGGFTYLLLAERGELFAGFAPSAALYVPLVGINRGDRQWRSQAQAATATTTNTTSTNAISKGSDVSPRPGADQKKFVAAKPVLHIAGENDTLVKYEWQTKFLDAFRRRNECSDARPWEQDKRCTIYKSPSGGNVLTYIHPGTHKYPDEAPGIIVTFFKSLK